MNSEYENMKKWKDKTLAKQNQKIIDDADFYWKDQASKLMVRVLRMISFLRKIMSLDMLRGNSRLRDEALEILDKYDPSEEELNEIKDTNNVLEWAATWIENSLVGEENARVIEFGKNMAMSIRANKKI
jgi:hypothetical protein